MSRSYRKPFVILSKRWDKDAEHSYRHRVKQQLREMEIDPDADWEEVNLSQKGLAEWGTRFGFPVDLDPEDTWYDSQERMKRK